MDLSTFYAVVAGTCFTLVGLWWNVVERRPEWTSRPDTRRLAGGTYLSFLVPGLMSILAQVDPAKPAIWRVAFTAGAAVGGWSTLGLMRAEGVTAAGFFTRNRWLVLLLYALVLLVAAVPDAADLLGLDPLEAAALLLISLVAIAHALTWEFMTSPPVSAPRPGGPPPG